MQPQLEVVPNSGGLMLFKGIKSALYDFKYELSSHDIFNWLPLVKAIGAQEVVFRAVETGEKRPLREVRQRFETIIKDTPSFYGLPSREGSDGHRIGVMPRFKLKHFVAYVKAVGWQNLPRAKSALEPVTSHRYTVTLRNQPDMPYRNSDRDAWMKFADRIGAYVFEDYDNMTTKVSMLERMSIYAGAKMNFGVASGQMFMLTLSSYPCISFDWGLGPQRGVLELSGIPLDKPMPWIVPGLHQTLWEPDTYDNLCRVFDAWYQTQPPTWESLHGEKAKARQRKAFSEPDTFLGRKGRTRSESAGGVHRPSEVRE